MKYYTVGVNFYEGYIHNLSVSYDISILKDESMKELYKLIHIQSGTSHISINGTEFVLTGPHVLYINEIDNISFFTYPENKISIILFKPSIINSKLSFEACNAEKFAEVTDMQDSDMISGFRHKVNISSKIIMLSYTDSLTVDKKIKSIYNLTVLQNTCSWPCASRAYLMELLFSLERIADCDENSNSDVIPDTYSKLSVDIICYLQTHYNEKITIEKLAQMFCTNRTTLVSEFKNSTGISINHYLTQLRIRMASILLRDTELSILEICQHTGFNDIGYFSKCFKKEISFTPSEYRNIYVHKQD
jgi:AraC family L-rhamnose operon regulatory protein RhaS